MWLNTNINNNAVAHNTQITPHYTSISTILDSDQFNKREVWLEVVVEIEIEIEVEVEVDV